MVNERSNAKRCIVWLRKDLRIDDHPAFSAAVTAGYEVLPVFLWNGSEHKWSDGEASQWWLHHALKDLAEQLKGVGGSLLLKSYHGDTMTALEEIISEYEIDTVFWGRRYEPEIIARDTVIKTTLTYCGVEVKSFNTHLLLEPHTVQNKSGGFYKVFTPYWKESLTRDIDPVVETDWAEAKFIDPRSEVQRSLVDLDLLPEINWDKGFYDFWEPTREEGLRRLQGMVKGKSLEYDGARDIPSEDGTSRISPWLQWGQVSAREIYHAFDEVSNRSKKEIVENGYLRQLFWREFSYHLLYHVPHTAERPLRPEYERFSWRPNEQFLKAWQQGMTGFPIVDAGMRQLWQTGWMHNRVRMIVSSFLVKHLLQDWREGASWFWDTLVDADLANNTMGWQWIAGCGADASPYFRVFNPIIQGKKFDPDGSYVKEYLPELADVDPKLIHEIWEVPPLELRAAGVTLGKEYPEPIISHQKGREQALAAYADFKETTKNE